MSARLAIGVFLARAWYEDDEFRARVTQCVDVETEPATNLAIAELDELMRVFSAWLTELTNQHHTATHPESTS